MYLINFKYLLFFFQFIPIIGILNLLFFKEIKLIKKVGFFYSIITFFYSILLWFFFNNNIQTFQMIFYIPILKYYNINYIIGIDNISLFFLNLTTFLILICFLNSWYNISKNVKEFFIYFFFLEFLLINVFLILDLFFFFIFFESILIPIFLIIGIWGTRENKIKAAFKFFFIHFLDLYFY